MIYSPYVSDSVIYFEATACDVLTLTGSVTRVLATIHDTGPPPMPMPIAARLWPAIRIPARRAVWLGGVGMIDPWLRRRLNIGWTAADETQFQVLCAISHALGPAIPAGYKMIGPGHLRWRHTEIATGPLGPSG